MKRFLIALAAVASLSAPAGATDVGVSVSIGQPGFYGQLDIGGFPRPALIYSQPVMVERVHVARPPLYLRVPPGHAKHWRKYCHRYDACGQRVYFVRNDWYQREYVPRYRDRHDHRRGHDHDHYRGDDRHDRNDRHNRHDRHDDDRGNGRGRDH